MNNQHNSTMKTREATWQSLCPVSPLRTPGATLPSIRGFTVRPHSYRISGLRYHPSPPPCAQLNPNQLGWLILASGSAVVFPFPLLPHTRSTQPTQKQTTKTPRQRHHRQQRTEPKRQTRPHRSGPPLATPNHWCAYLAVSAIARQQCRVSSPGQHRGRGASEAETSEEAYFALSKPNSGAERHYQIQRLGVAGKGLCLLIMSNCCNYL